MSKVPRLFVLTQAKPGELPTTYLADQDKFPDEPRNTPDLRRARHWLYPPGCRRYLKRNPHLVGYRRIAVPFHQVTGGEAPADPHQMALPGLEPTTGSAPPVAPLVGEPPAPKPAAAKRPRKTAAARPPGAKVTRRTKTDPNKRAKRALRLKAVRKLRGAAGKPGGRKLVAGRKSA